MSERRLGEQEASCCSGFPQAVTFFGFQHARIPPVADTCQSDRQTVHYLTGDEFYDLGTFRNRADFLANATLYQLYLIPPCGNDLTRHKGGLSPWQIIHQLCPRLRLHLCLPPSLLLDCSLSRQGDTIYLVNP